MRRPARGDGSAFVETVAVFGYSKRVELLCSGYGARIVGLVRPPGYGLAEVAPNPRPENGVRSPVPAGAGSASAAVR